MLENDAITALSASVAARVARWTTGVEQAGTAIERLSFYRREGMTDCAACIVEPSIALVVQGAKRMVLGKDSHHYDPYRFLITSVDLPATMQVLEASQERPYLGVVLRLDLRVLGELMLQAPPPSPREVVAGPGMRLGNMTPALMDAFLRLVTLLDEPESMAALAPLIEREICWRVLMSEQGARLRQIVSVGTQGHRIARVVEWLKVNFAQPLRVEQLAEIAQMSPSTFHHHFRDLTAMSPLQYQKSLRLMEARRLMLGENINAASAAFHVGYESPSQFSREYARHFGAPPKQDIDAMRQ